MCVNLSLFIAMYNIPHLYYILMKQNDTTPTFSNSKNINFQKENMIHKIKNIKKRKGGIKQYHDIEPLDNIHHTNNDVNDHIDNTKTTKKTIVEGLTLNPIYIPEEDDWTGQDDIYEGNRKKYSKERSTSEWIQFIYDELNKYTQTVISMVLSMIAGKEIDKDDSDVMIVKDILTRLLAISIASLSVINWMFVLFYKNENDERLYKDSKYQGTFKDVSHERVTELSKDSKFYRILLWMFGKSTNVIDRFQTNVIIELPDKPFVKNNTTLPAMFIVLFVILNACCYNFVGFLKDTLINFATFNVTADYLYLGILVSVMGLLVLSAMDEENFELIKFFLTQAHPVYIYIPLFLIGLILYIVYMFVFIGPVMYLGIVGYIMLHTMVAKYLYAAPLTNDEYKEEIYEFIEKNKPKLSDDSNCHPFGLMDYINMIIEFIYRHLYSITFIITMVTAIINVNMNIKVESVKLTLFVLFGMSIIITSLLNVNKLGLFMDYIMKPNGYKFETKDSTLDSISNGLMKLVIVLFIIFIGLHFTGFDKKFLSIPAPPSKDVVN